MPEILPKKQVITPKHVSPSQEQNCIESMDYLSTITLIPSSQKGSLTGVHWWEPLSVVPATAL